MPAPNVAITRKPVGGGQPLEQAASRYLARIEAIAKVVPGLADTGHAIWLVWKLRGRPEQIDQAVDRWTAALRNLKRAWEHNSASRGWVSGSWSGAAYDAFKGHMNKNEEITEVTMTKLKEIGQGLVDAGHKNAVDYHWALKQVIHAGAELARNAINETNVLSGDNRATATDIIVDAAKRIADRQAAVANAMSEQKARMQKLGFTAEEIVRPNSIPVASTRRDGWDAKATAKFSDIRAAGDKLLESSGEWGKAADNVWWAGQIPDDSLGDAGEEAVQVYKRISAGASRELATGCEKLGNTSASLWVVSSEYKNAEEAHADWVRKVWQAHDKVLTWRGHDPRERQWKDSDPWW